MAIDEILCIVAFLILKQNNPFLILNSKQKPVQIIIKNFFGGWIEERQKKEKIFIDKSWIWYIPNNIYFKHLEVFCKFLKMDISEYEFKTVRIEENSYLRKIKKKTQWFEVNSGLRLNALLNRFLCEYLSNEIKKVVTCTQY